MVCEGCPDSEELFHRDIDGRRAFFTLLDIKCDLVAFLEASEATGIDCRMVNEYIRTVFLLNEPKTFFVIKPFYCAVGHSYTLPLYL